MQISDGSYFDIEVGDRKNFLQYDNILWFEMIEYAGCAGQVFSMQLRLVGDAVKDLFLENNSITIKIGENENSAESFKLIITEHKSNQEATGQAWIVNICAVQDLTFYIERVNYQKKGTSLDVIEDIVKNRSNLSGFKSTISQVAESDENVWICNYQTMAEFMREAWLHMYIGDEKSCPVLYIDRKQVLHLDDLNKIKSERNPKFKFTAKPPESGSNNIQYINNFNPKSYKFLTNIYTGYGCLIDITNVEDGNTKVCIPDNVVDISSSKKVEKSQAGNRFITNKQITGNTHKYYQFAYYVNVARLARLSSIVGYLRLTGYFKDINIMDLIEVDDGTKIHSGYYLVDTKTTSFSYNTPVITVLTVCRDNLNRIEDNDQSKGQDFKVNNRALSEINTMLKNLRRVTSLARRYLNGDITNTIFSYITQFKYNLLSSIVFAGVRLDFNSKLSLMNSFVNIGNNIVNSLVNTYIPYPYNNVLQNVAIEKPTLRTLVSRLISDFGPLEIREFLAEITNILVDVTDISNHICKENEAIYNEKQYSAGGYGIEVKQEDSDMSTQENTQRVQEITDEFVNNVEGTDIPIPNTELTESESLLNKADLTNLLADKVIVELNIKGYLNHLTEEQIQAFKQVLLGEKKVYEIPEIIAIIRANIGDYFYYRYWGTFKDVSEVTDFFIKNSFKDFFMTAPTTKIINALKGAHIFIAYPKNQRNLTFRINSKEVDMMVLDDVDLGYYDLLGQPLLYTIYYSEDVYNSNSVVLEVRK